MSEVLPDNSLLSGVDLEIKLAPTPSEAVEEGSPSQGFKAIGVISGAEFGVWEMRGPGTTTDIEAEEVFIVLAGNATIELIDEKRSVMVSAGSIMRFSPGTRTRWIVPHFIRKVYLTEN